MVTKDRQSGPKHVLGILEKIEKVGFLADFPLIPPPPPSQPATASLWQRPAAGRWPGVWARVADDSDGCCLLGSAGEGTKSVEVPAQNSYRGPPRRQRKKGQKKMNPENVL